MASIFISYRRGPDTPYARGIKEKLAGHFGADSAFMDLRIRPGQQWRKVIRDAVDNSDLLIAIIGPSWAAELKARGRESPDADDWLQLELEMALEAGLPIIPVLVGGARAPRTSELPPQLTGLVDWQAHEVTDERWDYDTDLLVAAIASSDSSDRSRVLTSAVGIETAGAVTTKLFASGTPLPASTSEVFTTASDNQSTVDIHVQQGDRAMAAQNRSLGTFQLTGIRPARRGVPQIVVTFDIDVNGDLDVSAKDLATGKEQGIEAKASSEALAVDTQPASE